MKNRFILLAASLLLTNGVCQMQNFLPSGGEAYEVIMHNRPLAKINGKIFSVMDVKKKMDLFLHEHHEETFASPLLVYQFYAQNWRPTLQEMIDGELIKMEAEVYKINISDGDIRQEMDKRFGPNVVKRLDELKLSYDDAKELIRDDIIVRNMSWYRIWAKTLQEVTPETVKSGYEKYLASLPLKDNWTYKIATLRGTDESDEATVTKVYSVLLQEGENAKPQTVKGFTGFLPSSATLSISEPLTIPGKDLSPEILQVLKDLPPATFSKPIAQKSRTDGTTIYRMFYLIDHDKEEAPSFEQLSSKIHDTLVQKYGDLQRDEYLGKLRKRFLAEDLVAKNLYPQNFQPFTLCGS